jgi:hypothetical protein
VKKYCLLFLISVLLVGCSAKRLPPTEPLPPPVTPVALFPQPTADQSNQLARLSTLLHGPIARLDLSWVVNMGETAIPACVRAASDETLANDARDLILIVMGNTLKKAVFYEHPDAKNDLVVPVLLKALRSPEPRVRRSGAYAARFVDDARLVPTLQPLLEEKTFVQEQAVLALGTSGHEPEVMPIATLFFGTESGKFRYSCLYSLAMMSLLHDVDVASVLEHNQASFGKKNLANVVSVSERFTEFKTITLLVKQLSSSNASERRDANEKLRERTGRQMSFDPAGDEASRSHGIEEWREYFLKDYWLVPPPSEPQN